MRKYSRKNSRFWRIAIVTSLTITLLAFIYLNLRNNIHTVIKGQVYRSAQLDVPTLTRLYQRDHIKTIINLRGKNPSFASYKNEIAISKQLGIQHYDVRLWSELLPKINDFHRLIYLLQHAPRPILLHCKSGADRTGLAAAIALELNGVQSLADIEQQYSLIYLVTSPKSVGKQVFHYYTQWLQKHHYKNNKKHFLTWAYSKNHLL